MNSGLDLTPPIQSEMSAFSSIEPSRERKGARIRKVAFAQGLEEKKPEICQESSEYNAFVRNFKSIRNEILTVHIEDPSFEERMGIIISAFEEQIEVLNQKYRKEKFLEEKDAFRQHIEQRRSELSKMIVFMEARWEIKKFCCRNWEEVDDLDTLRAFSNKLENKKLRLLRSEERDPALHKLLGKQHIAEIKELIEGTQTKIIEIFLSKQKEAETAELEDEVIDFDRVSSFPDTGYSEASSSE